MVEFLLSRNGQYRIEIQHLSDDRTGFFEPRQFQSETPLAPSGYQRTESTWAVMICSDKGYPKPTEVHVSQEILPAFTESVRIINELHAGLH